MLQSINLFPASTPERGPSDSQHSKLPAAYSGYQLVICYSLKHVIGVLLQSLGKLARCYRMVCKAR